MQKTFVCRIIGTGTNEDKWRPEIADVPIVKSWWMHEIGGGYCIVTVVAEELDLDKIVELLGTKVTLVATRKEIVDLDKWQQLLASYPLLAAKWEVHKRCAVIFAGETGEMQK